jgi:tryptophan synthase alpha chain
MESVSPIISSEPDVIAARFRAWRAAGHCALIPYLTAGYPSKDATPALLDALVEAGADVIELGVPFSDPVADGPTIQRSSQRALEQGVTLGWTLDALHAFRSRHDTPVVLFTYLNPVLSRGLKRFAAEARAAGAQGVLLTDLPVGADDDIDSALGATGLSVIRLIAPTTSRLRALAIARQASGFLYYVARMGVTGATANLRAALLSEVAALRTVTSVPIAVGFGISTPEQAASVASVADGVVVGSALINAIDRSGVEGAREFLRAMRMAINDSTVG